MTAAGGAYFSENEKRGGKYFFAKNKKRHGLFCKKKVLSIELNVMMLRNDSVTGVLGREIGCLLSNQIAAMACFIFIYYGNLFTLFITV